MTARERGLPSISDTGGSDGNDGLALSFSEFTRAVHERLGPEETLNEIVRAAVALVPGCDEASISVIIDRRHVTSDVATGQLPRRIDTLQEELDQGPCLDAAYQHETVRVADMASETRWPQFAPAALDAGAAGMMCLQLYVEGDDLGALNLFARTSGAFTDESEHVGLMFAAHASVAYASSRNYASMVRKVATRQLIGQAQGILMERHKLTADNAFLLLVRVSQHRNLKLRDVAERLVGSGQLDVLAPVPPTP